MLNNFTLGFTGSQGEEILSFDALQPLSVNSLSFSEPAENLISSLQELQTLALVQKPLQVSQEELLILWSGSYRHRHSHSNSNTSTKNEDGESVIFFAIFIACVCCIAFCEKQDNARDNRNNARNNLDQ